MSITTKVGSYRPKLLLCLSAAFLTGCQTVAAPWPTAVAPAPSADAQLEAKVRSIVAGMTLEQKDAGCDGLTLECPL